MILIAVNILVLVFTGMVAWWLSGFDTRVTGEKEREDNIRRGFRCGVTLILMEAACLGMWRLLYHGDQIAGALPILVVLILALFWAGCVSEMASHGFTRLVEPDDDRQFDPKREERALERVANLVRTRRTAEAIQLCQALMDSGEASVTALEAMLERLGVKVDRFQRSKPLTEAAKLRQQGRFAEAETILTGLLERNGANLEAAMLLIRIYMQDLDKGDKAVEVLHALERQRHISPGHIEFARRLVYEGENPTPKEEPVKVLPESVDELLAGGHLGTAIEILEEKSKEQPGDFETWLKLAEVHGRHCGNLQRAESILRQMEANPTFSPEQMKTARGKLGEWKAAHQPR